MGIDRRQNGRAMCPRVAEEMRKRHWERKAAEGRRSHEIELLLNANVPLAEAISIVDETNVTKIR